MACVVFKTVIVASAFVSIVTTLSSKETRKVLMQKCCPLGQQLSVKLSCDLSGNDKKNETVGDLRQTYIDFPPWMDNKTRVSLSGNIANLSTSFLKHQPSDVIVRYGVHPHCDRQHLKYFNAKSKDLLLFSNGTLRVQLSSTSDDNPDFIHLTPEEFCTDEVNNHAGVFVYLTCPCDKVLCINKCCNMNQILSVEERRKTNSAECLKSNTSKTWSPRFLEPNDTNSSVGVNYITLSPNLPTCSDDTAPVLINKAKPPFEKFRIFPNGSVLLENYGHDEPYGRDQYCGELSLKEDGDVVENIFVCQRLTTTQKATSTGILYATLHLLGSLFLLLTLVVYGILPDLRSTYQGKAFMCHAASLFTGSVFVAGSQIQRRVSESVCYLTAFGTQFSFLAAFFWLNALCVDASLRLRRPFIHTSSSTKSGKFLYFSLYAWGCTLFISIVTAVLEFTEGLPDGLLRPDFGQKRCWFLTFEATAAYFYGPIGVLLLINSLLFLYTIYNIILHQRDSSVLNENTSYNMRKRKFILFLRLFVMMGITWIMELVSFAVGGNEVNWYFTDAVNMLRGVVIFVLFCCKAKVWRKVKERLGRQSSGPDSGTTNQSSLQTPVDSSRATTPDTQGHASKYSSIEMLHTK